MAMVSFVRNLGDLAAADPDRQAVTCDGQAVSRAELDRWTNRLARDFAARGAGVGDMVTIGLPNSIEWIAAAVAAWKVGAVPQPVSAKLPTRELAAILELAEPKVVVGVEPPAGVGASHVPAGYRPPADLDDGPLPDVLSPAWKAPTSGGSTGRPKLIVSGHRPHLDPADPSFYRFAPDGCLVMPGPLYHNGPTVWALQALVRGSHVVLLPRFDPAATLTAIEEHRADTVYLVPTMMKRILRLPDDVRLGRDLSSLTTAWHLAEPCPPWLKEAWIDWLGPEVVLELYAGTESQAITIIDGREWLAHRGSVGRPFEGEVQVCDPDGRPVPPGVVGEVWLRSTRSRPTYHYRGAEARTLPGGWESLGDMGHLDEDGYVYLSDRVQDLVISGGANIYPAEIEAALGEHPAVRSCVVIGLPDDDLGERTHAIVEADPAEAGVEALRGFLADHLVAYKIPRTWEYVDEPLRTDAGKVRRSALRAERLGRLSGVAGEPVGT